MDIVTGIFVREPRDPYNRVYLTKDVIVLGFGVIETVMQWSIS